MSEQVHLWKVASNPGGPEKQPAFPGVVDGTERPHGEDIICSCLGTSDQCKDSARAIVAFQNSYARHFGPDAVAAAEEDVLGALLRIVKDLAYETEMGLRERYGASHPEGIHPAQQRDFDLEMSTVREANAILARVPQESPR